MKVTSVSSLVEYLLQKKYPIARHAERGLWGNISHKEREPIQKKIAEYRAELEAKTPEELQKLYEQEKASEQRLQQLKAEQDERQRFFNLPTANADFEYWSKMPHWTLEEAIALSFGKNPALVNWERIKLHYASPFVIEYAKIREIALRAKTWKQLFDPVLPGIFIAWAKRNHKFPQELEKLVIARGGRIADWKTMYDSLETDYKEFRQSSEEQLAERDKKIEELREQRQTLYDLVKSLEAAKEAAPEEKPLGTKERESLLRLVIGMAIKGYIYDPVAPKNSAVSDIAKDLEAASVPLNEDTIRKWLREGSKLLPKKPSIA